MTLPYPDKNSRVRMIGVISGVALLLLAALGTILMVTIDNLPAWDAGALASGTRYAADGTAAVDPIARSRPAATARTQLLIRSQPIASGTQVEISDTDGQVRLASAEFTSKYVRRVLDNDAAGTVTSPQPVIAAAIDLTGQRRHRRDGFLLAALTACLLTGSAVGISGLAWYRRTKHRRRADARVRFLALHDALTGLANRELFAERLNAALARLSASGDAFSILLLDLDKFKSVNDSFGHLLGDALLKQVAQRLAGSVREGDLVARFGGDEFAILQTVEGDEREAAVLIASRIRDAIITPYQLENHRIIISTSIGIALAPAHGTQVDQLLKRADLALYRAKSDGRNQYRFFETALEQRAQARLTLEVDLRAALRPQQFELHYQPVIDISTRDYCGAEALLRWKHPRHGLILPDRFMRVAEDIGLMIELGEWIVRTACADAVRWPVPAKVAVNLSPVQFAAGDLVGVVTRALLDSKLSPEQLELEITEPVVLGNNQENISLLHQLKSLGVSIVLDDFGSGYWSLRPLRMFPFDKIKIDRSLVNELGVRNDCAAIVCAVVGLGRSLNIATLAEGIETEEQYTLLRTAGCGFGQGYLFGRPTPARWLGPAAAPGRPGIAAGA